MINSFGLRPTLITATNTSLLAGIIAELLPVPTQRPSQRREDADRECRG
jgi:hypothetical protein